jgi:repressor LexA
MVSQEKLIMVMDYIRKFSEENGYTPSVREIGKECGIKSTATVYSYLQKLQDKGYLNKATNKKRSVTLAKSSGVNIPLIGTVTAGQPIFAYENYEDYYTFPAGEFRGEDLFMLRMQATSLLDAGIMDGDKIVVRRTETA